MKKKLYDFIGKDKVKKSIDFHPKDQNEFYILECLELFCNENNFSQRMGLLEILRIGCEELYGKRRWDNK